MSLQQTPNLARLILAIVLLSPPYVLAADLGLVNLLTSQLGVTTPQAEGGAGAIFEYAKGKMTPDDFAKVAGTVPNMDSLLAAAPKAPEATPSEPTLSEPGLGDLSEPGVLGGDGTLGGLAGKLGGLQGLSGSFGQLGLEPNMVGKVVPMVVDYVKSSGGGSVGMLLAGALR